MDEQTRHPVPPEQQPREPAGVPGPAEVPEPAEALGQAAPAVPGRRGWLVVVSTVAVVTVLAVGVLIAVAATRSHWGPDAMPTPAASAPVLGPDVPHQATAADGGQLRVVEQGFTQVNESVELTLTPGYGPGHPEPYTPLYGAVIVENTSRTEVAIAPVLAVQYFDAHGKAVRTDDYEREVTVTAIFPGQRVGIPVFLSIDATTVSRMVLRPVGALWLAPAVAARYASSLTATDVHLIRTGSRRVAIVAFTVHSGYRAAVVARAVAIYRDRKGTILGASDRTARLAELEYPPGNAPGSIVVDDHDWLPANLDPSRTEVYLTVGLWYPL